MPSTKFPLHPTYGSGVDNNWWLKIAALLVLMDKILMEMSKMWKVSDGHMGEGWTMVNRPQHKLTLSKAPGELTIDLQDGCCVSHCGYHFSNFEFPCHPNASHQVLAKSDLPFRSRWGLKLFKMATLGAILWRQVNKYPAYPISNWPRHPRFSFQFMF